MNSAVGLAHRQLVGNLIDGVVELGNLVAQVLLGDLCILLLLQKAGQLELLVFTQERRGNLQGCGAGDLRIASTHLRCKQEAQGTKNGSTHDETCCKAATAVTVGSEGQ